MNPENHWETFHFRSSQNFLKGLFQSGSQDEQGVVTIEEIEVFAYGFPSFPLIPYSRTDQIRDVPNSGDSVGCGATPLPSIKTRSRSKS
jgi:hypothetical protein